jgi:CubicO group peptidase (beta-lactamase class C family)
MTIAAPTSVLESASPERMGIDQDALERLYAQIEGHIAAGRYPGAAVAMARHGKLVAARSFGLARQAQGDQAAVPAADDTLWLLYSQTKPVVSCAIWHLIERAKLRFHDPVAEYLPDFARNGKAKVTIHQLLSHQGGFPSSGMDPAAWENHDLMRETVCSYTLEWEPGARVVYHGAAAHWTQAALIEAVTGQDYRDYVREQITGALGLRGLHVGVPDDLHDRCAFMYQPDGEIAGLRYDQNAPAHWRAGVPGGGGYATATDLTTFYQMLLHGGTLNGVRIISPRMVEYVTRNHTGERIDEGMNMPMHRGMGVHVRGTTATIRGLGSIASPGTFGHGGAGSSYSWADPETGVSFTYLTNARVGEPWHSQRLDEIAIMAHAAIADL